MKNNILNVVKLLVLFIVVLGVLYFLDYCYRPYRIDYVNIAGMYAEEKNTLDMVYIGGSASFVYYEPLRAYENYGIVSYDYGANTIQAELYKYMVKELLEYQDPRLIVIDARAFQYREKDQTPNLINYRNVIDGMKNDKNRIEFISENVEQRLNEKETLPVYYSMMLYHSIDDGFSLSKGIALLTDRTRNQNKGFFFVPKAVRLKKQKFETDKVTKVADETDEILKDLLDYLDTIDNEVLFIVSPYVETESEKEQFNYVEQVITERGYKFIDSNEDTKKMGIDFDTDFYNYNHVNIFGADKYTDYLSEIMIEEYGLLDRRKDNNYKNWNDLLPSWNERVKETKEATKEILNGVCYNETIEIK